MFVKAGRQWIQSPLGLSILLKALNQDGQNIHKYKHISKIIAENRVCSSQTKAFVSASCKLNINTDIEQTDFSKENNAFSLWVHKNGSKDFNVIKEFGSSTEFVLANFTSFKSNWLSCNNSGAVMKIYNSFNYTQDVKYEARLLELPLQSGLKLVIIVPNEVDVLHTLFSTLMTQGLEAAVRSIQPLFTATCELNAPHIEVCSRVEGVQGVNVANATTVQYGRLKVDDAGTSATVLTCLHSPPTASSEPSECVDRPFYLAVVYEDMPLFIGQFTQ
ncbi:uncharacterized protein LOC142980083 [Anticarsia gemmatalis]|uniref:uncharacterized protein LOC142980083 n=1 Tax=Anticarsia gemmatalis TaxID=129554 RepID=UPI003F76FDC6